MFRKTSSVLLLVVLSLIVAIPAFADAPSFGPTVYGDGQLWGTKGTATLPAPTDNTIQAYDALVSFTNGDVPGQKPVAEAAPGNPAYNGGRWIAYDATWAAGSTPVLLTSYDAVMAQVKAGNLTLVETGNYFQCPLLPVK
jgi:hypothetical protein